MRTSHSPKDWLCCVCGEERRSLSDREEVSGSARSSPPGRNHAIRAYPKAKRFQDCNSTGRDSQPIIVKSQSRLPKACRRRHLTKNSCQSAATVVTSVGRDPHRGSRADLCRRQTGSNAAGTSPGTQSLVGPQFHAEEFDKVHELLVQYVREERGDVRVRPRVRMRTLQA
jgi:hypothetical protein